MKYVDPDGRFPYAVQTKKDEYTLVSEGAFLRIGTDLAGFAPFGGTAFNLEFRAAGITSIDSNKSENLKNEMTTYALDFASKLGDISEQLTEISNVAGKVGGALSLYGIVKDVKSLINKDLEKDNLMVDTLNKFFNYSIKGKSADEVQSKYLLAKNKFETLLSEGKISYKANWKAEIKKIEVTSDGYKELKSLIKTLDSIGN